MTKFDASYAGGVATFASGLTGGLIGSSGLDDQIVLLGTSSNGEYLAKRFAGNNVSVIQIDESRLHRYVTAMLGYLGFAFNNFKLPYWYDLAFRRGVANRIESAVDVLFVPMTTLSLPSGNVPSILSVHDIQHEYYPDYFSLRERAARWGRYRLSCWAASAVQASSQFVKDSLLEKFGFLTQEKIFIAPEGVDLEAFSPEAPMTAPPADAGIEPESFLFYPAQMWPHKNHLLLIEALAEFRDRHGYEMPCVLTGQDCGMLQPVMTAIRRSGLSEVKYRGKVPFDVLLWLYANCRAVLALGLHESSSLPLREGAAFGKPLICSDIAPNQELAQSLFLILFSSHKPADLVQAIERLISNSDIAKFKANQRAVKRFNWDRIAEDYLREGRRLVSIRSSAMGRGSER